MNPALGSPHSWEGRIDGPTSAVNVGTQASVAFAPYCNRAASTDGRFDWLDDDDNEVGEAESEAEDESDEGSDDEFEVAVEGKHEEMIYKEVATVLDDSFLAQKPARRVLTAYLSEHGLTTRGRKEVLHERVKDYQAMKTIGCKAKYAHSTFTMDCTSGLCTGDVILFSQKVLVRLGTCSYGFRFVAGRVTRCKYESYQGRFACDVEVLWSTGHCPQRSFTTTKLKRYFPFRSPIRRQPWADECRRKKVYDREKRKMFSNTRRRERRAAAVPPSQPLLMVKTSQCYCSTGSTIAYGQNQPVLAPVPWMNPATAMDVQGGGLFAVAQARCEAHAYALQFNANLRGQAGYNYGQERLPDHNSQPPKVMSEAHAKGLAAAMVQIPCATFACTQSGAKACVSKCCRRCCSNRNSFCWKHANFPPYMHSVPQGH